MDCTFSNDYLRVWTAYCDYLRRLVDDNPGGMGSGRDEATPYAVTTRGGGEGGPASCVWAGQGPPVWNN